MKRMRKAACIILSLALIASGLSFSFAAADNNNASSSKEYMQDVVEQLGNNVDGEKMFDYLSYVYLGWRTTGGAWQNQVIDNFVSTQLQKAGYTHKGSGSSAYGAKSSNDMSSATDDDYSWVNYFDVNTLTWDPEYAKLEITSADNFSGKDELISKVNIETSSFNPLSSAYQNYYGKNVDEMWQWIIQKDANGNRVNVLNGKEAELNNRCHLAWNSCFTDKGGTSPSKAASVTGEIVYIGSVTGKSAPYGASLISDLSTLSGKVLLTDSSLRSAFGLAQQVGAVAVMSKASLSAYSVPKNKDGSIVAPFADSARYASGAALASTSAQTATGKPIVEWQLSNNQYAALIELLNKSTSPVMAKNISIGNTYAMNDATYGGKGQAVSIAEIKGSTRPDERIFICAHVQEPGSNDNATGVASLLGIATEMKKMIDSGKMERPERTITFMWGDEMNMATYYMDSHPEEKAKIISVLDMDMTGEDTAKTGGTMRIEKTPDPSAEYNYTLDSLPWEETNTYDNTFKDSDGAFVRLPDSHTLWGAGSTEGMFKSGFYLNDLYMYATQNVIDHHDNTFQVQVCPYEGGSDHSKFLAQGIPALLTWHFTDYTYHTSVDTLAMSSASEMENVGITTLASALEIANATDSHEKIAKEMLTEVYKAAIKRFAMEEQNTINHQIYTNANNKNYKDELANEIKVLSSWESWYQEALLSVENKLLDNPSRSYKALRSKYQSDLEQRADKSVSFAKEIMRADPGHSALEKIELVPATMTSPGTRAYWHCINCDKYFSDEKGMKEISGPEAAGTIAAVKSVILSHNTYSYNGHARKPVVKITDTSGKSLTRGTDYTVAYKNNINVGEATATVTFKGNYSGTVSRTYNIVPKTVAKLYLKKGHRAFIARWNNDNVQMTGYQLRYSSQSSMKGSKYITKNSKNVKTYTVKKLKSNTKYYVQIRTYKKAGDTKYYSSWSAKISVKTN